MMYNIAMKKTFLFLSLLIVMALACDVSVNLAPTAETTPVPIEPPTTTPEVFIALTQAIPATEVPSPTAAFNGTSVFYKPVSLVLPLGLASGISGAQLPRADGPDLPPWELTPGHTEVKLEGYLLQGKLNQPQIYVYPALEYAQLFPGAFESMHRLRNVMSAVVPLTLDQLPAVPFFNAAQIFASNIQALSFQNGSGMRFLSEYAQYPAPVNNYELIYHFEGFTDDGEYYIIAIFPIMNPMLAETSDAGAPLPPGGIPYPYMADPANADMQAYYASIADLLNAAVPDAFSPSIRQLDALIQSIRIAP